MLDVVINAGFLPGISRNDKRKCNAYGEAKNI